MNGYFVVVPGVLVTSFIYGISSMIDQISKYSFGVKSEILKDVFLSKRQFRNNLK